MSARQAHSQVPHRVARCLGRTRNRTRPRRILPFRTNRTCRRPHGTQPPRRLDRPHPGLSTRLAGIHPRKNVCRPPTRSLRPPLRNHAGIRKAVAAKNVIAIVQACCPDVPPGLPPAPQTLMDNRPEVRDDGRKIIAPKPSARHSATARARPPPACRKKYWMPNDTAQVQSRGGFRPLHVQVRTASRWPCTPP